MNIRALIDRCSHSDGEAWVELWVFVEDVGRPVIRRMLYSRSLDDTLAEDVLQDFYLFLLKRNLAPLQTFGGTDLVAFRTFLRTVVVHFTLNVLRKHQRQRRRLRLINQPEGLPSFASQCGPTLWQIAHAIQELESAMTPADRKKWRLIQAQWNLAGEHKSPLGTRRTVPSERTFRRWSLELFRKYANNVL